MTGQHDAVIVGAGLAGLMAARDLHGMGFDIVVLERDDRPGGRLRTDVLADLPLDRGFALYNEAYPAARRAFDDAALDLQHYAPGVVIRHGGLLRLSDPLRNPGGLAATLRAVLVGGLAPPWRFGPFAAYLAACAVEPVARLRARPDVSLAEALRRWGVGDAVIERVAAPFLSGVFGDVDLRTGRRYADLVLRSFARGTPSVPAAGMQALADQLAAQLPAGVLRTGVTVRAVSEGRVVTSAGVLAPRVVIVATDPVTAAQLVPGMPVPSMAPLTTWYFATERALAPGPAQLVIAGARDSYLANASLRPMGGPGAATLVAATAVGHYPDAEAASLARMYAAGLVNLPETALTEIARYPIARALTQCPPGTPLRRRVVLADGLVVVGDHRDTPSIQGALVSGERGARAAAAMLRRR